MKEIVIKKTELGLSMSSYILIVIKSRMMIGGMGVDTSFS